MKKISLVLVSFTISIIFNFLVFEIIFPYIYFILFPLFEYFKESSHIENITFWILTIILSAICYFFISKFEVFNNKKKRRYISIIFGCLLIIFLAIVLPNHSNFPFQTKENENSEITKELDTFFKKKYKFKKANNYSEIENKIQKYYIEKLNSIKDQYEFSKYFKTYDVENKDKISVIVDTIVFSRNAEYFMATILIKDDSTCSQSSVIGENKKNIIISQNSCIENVSGQDLKDMRLNVRKFYLIDFNKREECFRIYENYNPSDDEYWKKVGEIIK